MLGREGITVVVPPKAAEVVALSKVSALSSPRPKAARMGMGIDAARQDELVRWRRSRGRPARGQGQRGDLAIFYRNIGGELIGRRGDAPASHNAIVRLRHLRSPSCQRHLCIAMIVDVPGNGKLEYP